MRHLLPISCTAALIPAVWLILTLPLAGFLLIGDALVVSEYANFALYAAGIGIGVSTLILFPLSLLHEWVARQIGLPAAAVPVSLPLISAACLLIHYSVNARGVLDTLFDWPGLLLAFSLAFGFYQTVLWLGKAFGGGTQQPEGKNLRPMSDPV
ncbi:MAG: hypothetical protein EOP86_25080 [Verrucomicrobiaceae bacterium]|nr:MAG: hypothetical protein EOP86_25080 [Verrucomicrobiaceae bacterium]